MNGLRTETKQQHISSDFNLEGHGYGFTPTHRKHSFKDEIYGRPTRPQHLNQQRLGPAVARRWTEVAQ